ncbi:PIN domain-containing protein [Actinoplanes sp. NEAU-A12]|uniref:PIN domain-containing protein n=1 Tax=Actinoplanes sandaracinus TaxID=3045177 RepID=A0ABT6WIZ0_9ACTN|nr:PIN domain-containing protein [Actinoplanes sandaracinus]MDI6099703.1 PIN domain-containing protein [Actinoplanes sandaracinus]
MSLESLVLDSQGFSGWIDRDRKAMRLLEQAERDGTDLVMSAATIIEVSHSGVDTARLSLLLSRIRVEAVTKESARRSADLLKAAGLHGHKYAIDAMVAEVALRLPAPVAVLTSDADDMVKLCGRRVRTIGL